MSEHLELEEHSQRLAALLRDRGLKVVFAESCTGGLVSASLVRVPGISSYHCGAAVVYRIDTKARWLGVPRGLLDDPGPVSREVAAAMAEGVLKKTPEADVAASVTGHLGPDAPPEEDGLIFAGVANREESGIQCVVEAHRLDAPPDALSNPQQRVLRQQDAAVFVLKTVAEAIV